jgi:hypothetical protein
LAKEQKTKAELAKLIEVRLNIGPVELSVFPSPQLGWTAIIITAPAKAASYQSQLEKIVTELRAKYDLKK